MGGRLRPRRQRIFEIVMDRDTHVPGYLDPVDQPFQNAAQHLFVRDIQSGQFHDLLFELNDEAFILLLLGDHFLQALGIFLQRLDFRLQGFIAELGRYPRRSFSSPTAGRVPIAPADVH